MLNTSIATILDLNLESNSNTILHFRLTEKHGICVAISTNIARIQSSLCYVTIVLWTIKKD
jgi:hypothetical protein